MCHHPRVGGVVTIPIDVRVIAATHQPLQEMIAARQFRQDLYYRINTLRLPLPTLRERPADLKLLAQTLVARAMKRLGSLLETESIMAPLLPYLSSYAWPGNVRELENIANRIAVFLLQFSPGETISYDGLREDCPELFLPAHFSATDENGDAELRVTEALRLSEGNRTLAAQRLGISRSTLWRRMQKKIK